MIIAPLQNSAVFDLNWMQKRPRISQHFGLNPQMYSQYGMKGHNGTDYAVPIGTPVFAPMDGEVKVIDSGVKGYGLHVKLRNPYKAAEMVLGHLSEAVIPDGHRVRTGEIIGYSGNSGYSTGPHLHMGYRMLKVGKQEGRVWEWEVMDYSNGFFGYIDFLEYVLNWKGTHEKFTL
jgi:murein DD-endopeptidase MepM/ murein hydrolase activator NlpD